MRPTVFLFDIDGTLVTTGGAGRRAMQRGFGSIYGRPEAMKFHFDGLTDRIIARMALESIGEQASKEAIDRVIDAYLEALADEVGRVPSERYLVHNGVREAVQATCNSGAAVGLGTGNVLEGARLKLERVGLFEPFAFGGYGSDADERPAVIRVGAERGAQALGLPLEACRVVVIGDTPKDVDAARALGAECIGVATGSYSCEALRESGADFAFRDLSEEGALRTLLGSG